MKSILSRIMATEEGLPTLNRSNKNFASYEHNRIQQEKHDQFDKFQRKCHENRESDMKLMRYNIPVEISNGNIQLHNVKNEKSQDKIPITLQTYTHINPITQQVTIVSPDNKKIRIDYVQKKNEIPKKQFQENGFRNMHEANLIDRPLFQGKKENKEIKDFIYHKAKHEADFQPKLRSKQIEQNTFGQTNQDLSEIRMTEKRELYNKIHGQSKEEIQMFQTRKVCDVSRKMQQQSLESHDLPFQKIRRIVPPQSNSQDFPLDSSNRVQRQDIDDKPNYQRLKKNIEITDSIMLHSKDERKLFSSKKRIDSYFDILNQKAYQQKSMIQSKKRVDYPSENKTIDNSNQPSQLKTTPFSYLNQQSSKEYNVFEQSKRRLEDPGYANPDRDIKLFQNKINRKVDVYE